jgi:hypothetical protein
MRSARAKGTTLVVAALLAIAASAAMAGPAGADELVYKGCIAAQSKISHGKKVCKESGQDRVFDGPLTLAVSPGGSSLYTGSGISCDGQVEECYPSATVGRFSRDPVTGSLDYRDCATAVKDVPGSCEQIPGATPGALGAGLGDVQSLVVSPDGETMYAASPNQLCGDLDCYGGNALARFDRDPATGAITYRDCITGDTQSGPSGSGACSEIPTAAADGSSGLDGLESMALSADGKSLYAGTATSSSVVSFDRDPQTGALTYRGCISGNKELGPSGSGACSEIPTATARGYGSGLGSDGEYLGGIPVAGYPILVSPDGKFVYAGAAGDASIARFERDPATGGLTYRGCIAGKGSSAASACSQIPDYRIETGSLVMSPDGKFIYGAGVGGVTQFRRDPETGALSYVRTVNGAKGESIALGDNGRALYTGSYDYSTVAHYSVNPKSGRPRYAGCLTSVRRKGGRPVATKCALISTQRTGHASGLKHVTALVASGKTLYAATSGDVVHFALAPQTRIAKPKIRGHRATFKFHARPSSRFECKLKGKGVQGKLRHWRSCGSHGLRPKGKQTYRHLAPGKKTFRVRATDRSRTTDPTPAKRDWNVR